MIKSVVVPLDGSELAEEALSYAVPIASEHGVTLHLVFVISQDASASEDDEARKYLAGKAEAVECEAEIHVRIGSPAEEIIEAADALDDPLIVMTTHGRTGFSRWIYGSVADKVIHAAESPVLMLRKGFGAPGGGAIKKIVSPLDGSAYSEAALNFAKSLATTFDADLHVVSVVETGNLYVSLGYETYAPGAGGQPMADIVEHMVNESHKYIAGVTRDLQDEGFRVQGAVLEGFAGEELLAYERKTEPQMVVMATRGRSGVDRFIFGSVAERILKSGETPVLMVKPSGELEES